MATNFSNKNGGQFLEDLSTSYWLSEALFAALELNLFETIENSGDGLTILKLANRLDCSSEALSRYLNLLIELGLVDKSDDFISNSKLSRTFLLKSSPLYQGDIIRWRKNMVPDWQSLLAVLKCGKRVNFLEVDESEMEIRRSQYVQAMDNVAKLKANECASFIKNFSGRILDVGSGSGAMALAFLEKFPDSTATLIDIEQILPQTNKFVSRHSLNTRVNLHAANILDKDWDLDRSFDLIILSNILHAYSENEVIHILRTTTHLLSQNGQLLIHDFFMEHNPIKARLSDINMLLNTYNGKVFSAAWVIEQLQSLSMITSPIIPLETDTAVILAGKEHCEFQISTT
ncbi:class I SAM-dependent methyltransferase [Eubacteriaceae bacterium ES3]|nr:class I SAM-dependent methyltransferase [Eubacteriaceae bacterium ES3]